MKKEELIGRCEEAVKLEEDACQIYMRHLSAVLLRSGIPEEDLKRTRETLEYLIGVNAEHKRMLERLIVRIREEKRDVY